MRFASGAHPETGIPNETGDLCAEHDSVGLGIRAASSRHLLPSAEIRGAGHYGALSVFARDRLELVIAREKSGREYPIEAQAKVGMCVLERGVHRLGIGEIAISGRSPRYSGRAGSSG